MDDRDNFLMNRHYGLGWAQIKWMLSTDHAGLAFKIAVGNTPSFFHLADTPMGMKMVGGAFAAG